MIRRRPSRSGVSTPSAWAATPHPVALHLHRSPELITFSPPYSSYRSLPSFFHISLLSLLLLLLSCSFLFIFHPRPFRVLFLPRDQLGVMSVFRVSATARVCQPSAPGNFWAAVARRGRIHCLSRREVATTRDRWLLVARRHRSDPGCGRLCRSPPGCPGVVKVWVSTAGSSVRRQRAPRGQRFHTGPTSLRWRGERRDFCPWAGRVSSGGSYFVGLADALHLRRRRPDPANRILECPSSPAE